MALFKFSAALFKGQPIEVFNHGNMKRDFTFVADLVEAMARLLPPAPPLPARRLVPAVEHDSLSPVAPWRASISARSGRSD